VGYHECHRLFELVAPEHLVSADAIEDACLGEADVLVTAFDGVELVFEDATGSVGDVRCSWGSRAVVRSLLLSQSLMVLWSGVRSLGKHCLSSLSMRRRL